MSFNNFLDDDEKDIKNYFELPSEVSLKIINDENNRVPSFSINFKKLGELKIEEPEKICFESYAETLLKRMNNRN